MSPRGRAALLGVVMLAGFIATGCRNGLFGRQYEYEEDLTLALDGSATLVVNASFASLVTLRGLPLETSLGARAERDRERIRAAYQSPVTDVQRVSAPWIRAGRRFIQVRVKIHDIRRAPEAAPFSWSRYQLSQENGHTVFHQVVGASALRPGTLRNYGWDGRELVAFRLHLPSKILWHNARDLETDVPAAPARGNILGWEQPLADRLDGRPIEMRVELDSQSILYRTLWLFGGAFLAAIAVLAALIWWTMRKGAEEPAAPTA
jgi:hypothetical protein